MLTLRLFGVGKASYGSYSLSGFPHQQPGQLLSYLILNRNQQHHRERLAAVFWADHTSEKARKNLRNALSRMHRCFENAGAIFDDYILVQEDRVAFQTSSSYWLDVQEFELTTSQVRGISGADLTPEQAHQLEGAVALYEGDLLESIYADWCLYERERLRLAYLNSLEKLMNFCGVQGNYNQGIRYGNRLLNVDSTREKIHRAIMALYWCKGDRNAAIAQYKICYQVLREELGLQPMDETRWLYAQILHNSPPERWLPDSRMMPPQAYASKRNPRHTEFILQKIHLLQSIMDDFGNELHSLEDVLKNSLPPGLIDSTDSKGTAKSRDK
jgi:DNA-binding SARP family transcriptional activator